MSEQNEITFGEHVAILAKPGHVIVNEITAEGCHLTHMALGVAGEAGELVDAIKKASIYNKPLDRDNVVEELGDLWFYMNGIMNELDIDLEEVEKFNRTKLAARYPKGYSDKAAQERADKVEIGVYMLAESEEAAQEGRFIWGPHPSMEACDAAESAYTARTGKTPVRLHSIM